MNLIDLVSRRDKHLLLSGIESSITHVNWLNSRWKALTIRDGFSPRILIRSIGKIYSLRAMPAQIGWFAMCDGKGSLTVSLSSGDCVFANTIELSRDPKPLTLPWPADPGFLNDSTTLSVEFQLENKSIAHLLVHQCLDRRDLVCLARGRGVEIGPGPNPQIHPNDNVEVEYVEELPVEKCVEVYDQSGRYKTRAADFSNYTIGTVWNLPQKDGSLDFVFSSHVFEHLANPIGHLLRWKRKLKLNGLILGVVPDLNGTKDFRMAPSTIDELYDELERGIS